MNIVSAKYLYDMDDVNKTHILLDLGNNLKKSVPIKEDNTDYQAIQKWVAEGNTIQEAD
tara:strand:+ start:1040 stop:1216 length:177 start_codon:yes stop_codon:yes gene_type:complete